MIDWFNKNLADYIDAKEQIIIDTRKNARVYLYSSLLKSLFISLFLTFFISQLVYMGIFWMNFGVASGVESGFSVDFTFVAFLFMVLYMLSFLLIYNNQRSIRYVLTNCGIYKITGLVFKRVKFVAYNQVTDVKMSRGPIERMFGAGSIGVGTASGNVVGNGYIYSKNELDIESVDDYNNVKEIIIKQRKQ